MAHDDGKKAGAGTVVLSCGCLHAAQDRFYGSGRRVHNRLAGSKTAPPQSRCTVCGTVKTG